MVCTSPVIVISTILEVNETSPTSGCRCHEGLHHSQRSMIVRVGRRRRGKIDPDGNMAQASPRLIEKLLIDEVERR